jgi:Transglutaminase-like superfamily
MPRLLRLPGKIAGLGPTGWCDCIRACFELALANRLLGARTARELLEPPAVLPGAVNSSPLSQAQDELVERVAFAIPRVSRFVPWRSDCLVQALAARRWLASHAIGSQLCIGVRKPGGKLLDAHAWLKVRGALVTGGDISGYTPVFAPETIDPQPIPAGAPPGA